MRALYVCGVSPTICKYCSDSITLELFDLCKLSVFVFQHTNVNRFSMTITISKMKHIAAMLQGRMDISVSRFWQVSRSSDVLVFVVVCVGVAVVTVCVQRL